jgi:dTDP-4-dehydrorhamnose 3,5-epimerase
MLFTETPIHQAYVIDLKPIADERGFFARAFCSQTMAAKGLASDFPQHNLSTNLLKGTLRGLHYQRPPYEEAKLVRCIQGELFDLIVDLRPESPTYGQHHGVVLSATNHKAFYVPAGCAHGYLTLTENTEALYMSSHVYVPGSEVVLRYDDPTLNIVWPAAVTTVSVKDSTADLLAPNYFLG